MKCVIYKIWKDGDSNVYIGSTTKYKKRIREHKSTCTNENSINYNIFLYQYIRQNGGWEQFSHEILHECEVDDKFEKLKIEGEWMQKFEHRLNKQTSWGCKDKKDRNKKYYEQNKEALKEQKKIYYEQNKEALKEQKKIYREQNKEALKEYHKKYREQNKEVIKERKKIYREKNKEAINERKKQKVPCPDCSNMISRSHLARHRKESCKNK